MNDDAKQRELQQTADAYAQGDGFPKAHDNLKITTDDQGKPVLLGRRHDDHTAWDELAK